MKERRPRLEERPFLTARWESLVLLNFPCPPGILRPLVPAGTELDDWGGRHLVSLVGFRFVDTRVRGWAVPGHRTFDEVNLRFYVRRTVAGEEPRRGVVFVRELVPRRAIALVARLLYNEPYLAVPMSHEVRLRPDRGGTAKYAWRHEGKKYFIEAEVSGPAAEPTPDSEARFITEHYWGYTRQRDGSTLEYEVKHPTWRTWEASTSTFAGPKDDDALYGPELSQVLGDPPVSAFIALGSEVAVFPGRVLDADPTGPT